MRIYFLMIALLSFPLYSCGSADNNGTDKPQNLPQENLNENFDPNTVFPALP